MTLTIERDGEVFDLTITRAEIVVVEVESELLDGHVGYIALHGFSAQAADQFSEHLGDLLDAGADQIVFDLRDNPGGYITAAQDIASEFIEEGLLFTQEGSGDEVVEWEATGEGQATDPSVEVVVLINGGSASASEIVAAALDETRPGDAHRRADLRQEHGPDLGRAVQRRRGPDHDLALVHPGAQQRGAGRRPAGHHGRRPGGHPA